MHKIAMTSGYQIVRLADRVHSVHSLAHGETFHPVVGPEAEAEALHVKQLRLVERLRRHAGEFVVWDVGLGAAGNALTVLRAGCQVPCTIHLLSFDRSVEPLRFALQHEEVLGYVAGYQERLKTLLDHHEVAFSEVAQNVHWELHVADFPSLLTQPTAQHLPKPHAILFDPFSPATNPDMWTLPLFTDLFRLLDPERPCALSTYSRSTMFRVTLLLAGFYVGAGHATGEKEETTVAANTLDLIEQPLDRRWLTRTRRSTSAEPLREPAYRQARLAPETWERLQQHPQF